MIRFKVTSILIGWHYELSDIRISEMLAEFMSSCNLQLEIEVNVSSWKTFFNDAEYNTGVFIKRYISFKTEDQVILAKLWFGEDFTKYFWRCHNGK